MNLQEFIVLKLMKEEQTVAMLKYDQYFHKRHILIKMPEPFLILLSIYNSNQSHMENLQFMVLIVDDQIRMSMLELNDEYSFPPVTYIEDDEYEEVPGDDEPPE